MSVICRRRADGPLDLASRPSKNPDGLALDPGTDVRRKTVAGRVADFHIAADRLPDCLVCVHELKEPEALIRSRIDEHIHIGIPARLVAGMRSEQIERRHPELPQGRFGVLESGDDFVPAHEFEPTSNGLDFPDSRLADSQCSRRSPHGAKRNAGLPVERPPRISLSLIRATARVATSCWFDPAPGTICLSPVFPK